jgi:hypothetical protein
MAHDYPVVDLNNSNVPDLAEVAEEVHRTRQPRVIRRADEDLAVIAPVKKQGKRPAVTQKSAEAIAAAWATFGRWKGVDVDRFLRDNEESRRISTRPPVELSCITTSPS